MNNERDRYKDEQVILAEIRETLRSLRYGSLQIIVQDGKVVQIEKTEKIRLARSEQTQRPE